INIPFVQIEDNVLLPVEMVSDKEEYSAATLRRKYNKKLEEFDEEFKFQDYKGSYIEDDFDEIDLSDYKKYLKLDESVKPVEFQGGHDKGLKIIQDFLKNKLEKYSDMRNDPVFDYQSNISPYLHFGMISPIEINDLLKNYSGEGKDDFFEEAFVRRELAKNFCYYNKNYDNFDCITGWARDTLKEHENDEREYIYTFEEFEEAKTHDEYWNAAQLEMIKTGKMHGYMRMYWAKKVLEWTEDISTAYDYLIKLNDKYELDGREENGYTGVAWTFGKHDRAWTERKVFGKTRYMNANGLKRKFDIDKYVEKIKDLD
ncbi:MAG: deoxyribodipyrimidine photo-lyase, partial [Thermotogota bacterium]